MKQTVTDFNPFEYMESQEEIVGFLRDCLNDEDPATFISALGHLARFHGMSDIAKQTGLSRESMYRSFSGKTQPKWDTVIKVVKCLNLDVDVKPSLAEYTAR